MKTRMSPPPQSPPPGPPHSPRVPASPKDRLRLMETIFLAALEQGVEGRAAFLAERCGRDAALRAEVEEMLAADAAQPNFLQGMAEPFQTEAAGDMIGHYKLREQIGEGGFGTVWVAEQEQPVRRRVALKIIKLGMDTKEVIARFEQERQALAMMDHPNIAKVLDAGATATGRPYFVMELVRGLKITDYCDEKHLSTAERIDLFITVCQAVQHAHQKGIIHRDLKPSNLLVTINDGRAVPKVIDFGVAKATRGRLSEHTVYTQFQQMVGTPLYMSPEQAELTSLDIDTRSDIYSLGVLLYQLLTGHTPIDQETLGRVGLDEIRRLIREVEPPRPSQRMKTLDGAELTTAAKRRNTEPAKLPGALRGDLDWIVMKCLEKDRSRRYETASALALDLERHRHNEMVVARPPTTRYLLSKLIRRNKLAFAASAAIAVSLVVGITVSVWQARRANLEATRSAEALNALRASAPAFAEQARGLAAREQFTEAIDKLDYAITLRPDAAEFLVAKGDLLQCQRKLAEAATMYREALRVQPRFTRAEESAKLCEELLAAPLSEQGQLSRESLAKLHLAMQKQQRPAAELLPVARLLGEEKKLLVDYWLGRLQALPVSAERPLRDRLTVREDGRLALDLSDTKVADLSPLVGAPLAVLNLSSSVAQLTVGRTPVTDLAPLREMHTLEKLDLSGSEAFDLSPLRALRLKSLSLRGCAIRDLNPLKNMPLEELDLARTLVSDLAPLIHSPIKSIDLSWVPLLDFSPLAQLPLEKCYFQRNRITDLAILRGKPLKELVLWGCANARNYAVLSEIKSLELLLLPSSYRQLAEKEYAAIGGLRSHPKLRQLSAEFMSQAGYEAIGAKDTFWQDWDREQTFIPALRQNGIPFMLTKRPDGTLSLFLSKQPIRDLSLLSGAQISELILEYCPVADLTPLQSLKLERLQVISDDLTDLSPLRGLSLTSLYLHSAKLTDLTPLRGLPLKDLHFDNCGAATDVAPIAEIATLENVTVPCQARNLEVLRKLPRLKRLGFNRTADNLVPDSTKEEFWKDYDANPWIAGLQTRGVRPHMLKRLPDGMWSLALDDSDITDLSVLQGARISELSLKNTPVTDLGPLRGLPLKKLMIGQTKVTDLAPLRGMSLTDLKLTDCDGLSDLSPLAEMGTLRNLLLPPAPKNIEFLRGLPKLERLGFREEPVNESGPDTTAAEFWKEYDANKK